MGQSFMFAFFNRQSKSHKSSKKPAKRSYSVERLEERSMLATFTVLNLNDAGAGSLRQAISDANNTAGADTIEFDTAGTISLASALPVIKDEVDIDGTTAPGFNGAPVVELDFNNNSGLRFNAGADGSALTSLAIVDASGSGVTLYKVTDVSLVGNYIGLSLDGTTVVANRGHGLELKNASSNNIGGYIAEDANFISGNYGNGVYLNKSSNNVIAGNLIGTDVTGTVDLGNLANGIMITGGSANNLIGGEATGGNDPTDNVFVRPPQGNLISGNDANGVLITGKATGNQLSGNYIGTDATGNAALGNSWDGVAIVKANGNSLYGCTFEDNPFVFYNVVSGNGGNGLRVANSNNTTIQANFFGMGANNDTAVGNGGNGVVVEGSSKDTVMGGPIPLGNVVAANNLHGIVVKDKASYFTTYNTFCGLAAFSDDPNFGNGANGMLITSTGSNILIRTNVITRNGGHGIEVAGKAKGVRIAGNIIGLNTNGSEAMGNDGNGIQIGEKASNIIVGGPQPTFNVIPHNVISANGGHGVAVVGSAKNTTISHSYIGTDLDGFEALGNTNAGIYLGSGTQSTSIGSTDQDFLTIISGNGGNGIEMNGTQKNSVIGTFIGLGRDAHENLGNGGNGIAMINSSNNEIGKARIVRNGGTRIIVNMGGSTEIHTSDPGPNPSANLIAHNDEHGVNVVSGIRNGIHENSIYSNHLPGINLAAGGNLNQAAPVITSVQQVDSHLRIIGQLTSKPKTTYVVEFFATDAETTSGRHYLGSLKVKTNADGVVNFTFYSELPQDENSFITTTATDSKNNTSAFSNAVQ
jgi:hypothetical protein